MRGRCSLLRCVVGVVTVPLMIVFLAPAIGAQTTTVTFDNPVPPGASDSFLNGVFQGIDFGTGRWRWEGPFAADATNNVYFDSATGTSRTFTFSPAPRVLNSMRVFTVTGGTLTLTDNLGQTRTQAITVGTMQPVNTGWAQPSSTVTVNFTAGWDLGVDDIAYTSVGPPDTTPPTVSMTGPADGATVSNTITVSATASDNVGVAGVQLLLDGAPLGAEDLSAPYAISWDTTTAANGPHTLSARARDAANNTATATSITVTVSNSAPPGAGQIGQWAGPFAWPQAPVHMALLRTGRVLMFDEASGGPGAQLWDPATNSFLAVPMGDNIFCAGHALLADGTLLVNGGTGAGNFYGIAAANLFDSATQTWTSAAPSSYARWYPTTMTLPDGRILTVSGQIVPGTTADIPEIYDPLTNIWTPLPGAQLTLPLYPLMYLLTDGRVLAAGSDEAVIPTRVLDLIAQTWTTVDPNLIDGSSGVTYLPNRFMKSGTQGDVDAPVQSVAATTYVLDMTQPAPAWRQTASMAFARAHHNLTLLPDGTVLVSGGQQISNDGRTVSQAVYAAELWNPATQTWTTMASMQRPRLYHSNALLLPDGRVLSAGGYWLPYVEQNAEIYSPPYLFKGPRPTITSAPTAVQHGASFFVGTPDAATIARVSLVRLGDVTHQVNMDQRFLPLTFQPSPGGLLVQAPADANVAPPGYYMLFLMNANGVPSISSLVAFPPSGSRNSALRFRGHGVNDIDRVKIRIDDPSSTLPAPPANIGATDFTLEFWMLGSAAENPAPAVVCGANHNWIFGNIVIDRDRYNQDRKFGLSLAGGRPVWGVTGVTSELTLCGATSVLDDQWHHIAVQHRVSDGQMSLFVDGRLEAQGLGPAGDVSYPYHATPLSLCGPGGNQPCTNSDPFLVIGAEKHDAGSQYPSFSGWAAELRLSNTLRYLSSFTPPSQRFTSDASTVGLYHFDEGTGNVIRDSSGTSGGPTTGQRKAGGATPPGPGPQWVASTLFSGNAVPTTTSLSPTSAAAGGAAFTLTVGGTNFINGSVVRWNGGNRTTTFGSSSQLTAAIAAPDIATAGTASITVFNPAPGGGTSNALTFTISASATTTVTFDNPLPPGSSGAFLNGLFQGIDFGTSQWRWENAYGADPTRHIYFASNSGTSRTFTFSPGPRTLVSMRVFTGVAGTLTLTDNLGQSKTQTITTGSMQLVTTGWTQPSTTVTVTFTAGWELGVDDIVYRNP